MKPNIVWRRPSASTGIAFVALLAALSGTAAALPGRNTVDSADIRNGQVKRADIRNSAVTSGKVRDRSLLARDFRPGELSAGPKGDKGDTGDPGTPGRDGSALGFASVAANGTVDPAFSENVAQANVSHVSNSGVYCFSGLPFTPRNAVGNIKLVGGANVAPGPIVVFDFGPHNGCAAGTQVTAVTANNNAILDRPFLVLFN